MRVRIIERFLKHRNYLNIFCTLSYKTDMMKKVTKVWKDLTQLNSYLSSKCRNVEECSKGFPVFHLQGIQHGCEPPLSHLGCEESTAQQQGYGVTNRGLGPNQAILYYRLRCACKRRHIDTT